MAGSVTIVGGGIAGLIAAAELARAGAKVTVFEAANDVGGRARTRQVDGFSLNQGPHAVYLKGAFLRTLKRLGVGVPGNVTKPAAPMGLYRGKLGLLPRSAGSLAATKLYGLRDKMQLVKVQKAIVDGATGEGSFAAWLDAQKLRPAVRASIEALMRVSTYANAPELLPAAAALEQIRFGIAGVIYVDGGWTTLVEGLRHAAVAAGAEVWTGARAKRIAVEGSKSRLVLEDGAEHVADATLLALGPHEAAGLTGSASLADVARAAIPVKANTLDLALERFPEGGAEFVLGLDRSAYLSLHSRAARVAPAGGAMVHVAKYLPADGQPGADPIGDLEQLADIAMPGWRALEKRRQTLIGMTVSNWTPRWDRARPGVAVADAPGVFVAGDWVGDEGMISDAAAASAVAAARAIMARLGVVLDRAA